MKSSDNIRCIRKYEKKDGTVTYHAEVRRKNAKPLRESFPTLTQAKNWVRKVESSILEGKHVPDNKARKYTLSDLIDQYTRLHLSKHNVYLNGASKLLTRHHETLDALLKYRRKGEQRVHVEHVHIHGGGQAIVGNVTTGGGFNKKFEEGPHAKV